MPTCMAYSSGATDVGAVRLAVDWPARYGLVSVTSDGMGRLGMERLNLLAHGGYDNR